MAESSAMVNLSALHEYCTYSYIVSEQTIIDGIYRVPPAHVLVVRDGQVTCRSYWDFTFQPTAEPPDEEAVVEHLGDLLSQAVKRRMLSDVPLGAFLSGGIDSSVVVALMAQVVSSTGANLYDRF